MKKILISIIIFLLLAIVSGGLYYWYFFVRIADPVVVKTPSSDPGAFSPFNNTPVKQPIVTNIVATSTPFIEPVASTTVSIFELPKLRQISSTPVAGFTASSTASSSLVRFIDRGTGHVYEAMDSSKNIQKISNTTLPKVYEAYSNRNGTAFVIRYLKDQSDSIINFYTELRSTGTSTSQTPFELKGRFLSPDIKQITVSPLGDKVFTWNIESGKGVGYISSFDEKNKIKVVGIPLTQVNIDWPELSTLILSTNASALSSSYIYSINAKTGEMKSVIGGIKGLTGKMSKDLTKFMYSGTTQNNFATSILNTKDNVSTDLIFHTLSEKCVWSSFRKNELYCAVPVEIPEAVYPDDWYKGSASFIDQIWHLNTTTGEVHLLSDPLKDSGVLVDAYNLTLDSKDNTLYFMNKRDLSLWALDLSQ